MTSGSGSGAAGSVKVNASRPGAGSSTVFALAAMSGSANGRSLSNSEGTAAAAMLVAALRNFESEETGVDVVEGVGVFSVVGFNSNARIASAMGFATVAGFGSGSGAGGTSISSGSSGSGIATNTGVFFTGGVNPWLGSSSGLSGELWLSDSRGAIARESSGSALINVMESESPIAGSMAAPNRTCALSGTNFCKRCISNSISKSVRSSPPDRCTNTVCASLSKAP